MPLPAATYENLLLRMKQQQEMQKMRQLQEQKAQMPDQAIQGRIHSTNQALVILPYYLMSAKQLMLRQRNDPDFAKKFRQQLYAYQQRPEDYFQGVKQQYYKVPPDREMQRFFSLGGQLYSIALPGLMTGTGGRGGYNTYKLLDPHIPNYNVLPDKAFEMSRNLYPRLSQDYKQFKAHPLYQKFVDDDSRGAAQGAQQWRRLFSDEDYRTYSPGIFKNKDKLPMSAIGAYDESGKSAGYWDPSTGKTYNDAPELPIPIMKSRNPALDPGEGSSMDIPSTLRGGPGG